MFSFRLFHPGKTLVCKTQNQLWLGHSILDLYQRPIHCSMMSEALSAQQSSWEAPVGCGTFDGSIIEGNITQRRAGMPGSHVFTAFCLLRMRHRELDYHQGLPALTLPRSAWTLAGAICHWPWDAADRWVQSPVHWGGTVQVEPALLYWLLCDSLLRWRGRFCSILSFCASHFLSPTEKS